MKPRHAAALALITLASCGPDMATIKSANERAEGAAERAQAAQLRSERSAALAEEAVNRTKSADYLEFQGGGAAFGEGSSKWWAMKAQDVVQRLCSVCDNCGKGSGPAQERYREYRAIQEKACSEPWPARVEKRSK